MQDIVNRRKKASQQGARFQRVVIPDWMGYPRSDFSRYDPFGDGKDRNDRSGVYALEGAGRRGWDYDQNRGYGLIYGDNTPRQSETYRDHRGKGPRSYVRPDARIAEEIHERLERDWSIDVSDVEVEVTEGVVRLTGNVNDRGVKYRVEDIIETIRGVLEIENRIRVGQRS